jgi:methylmalonyl-CoA/ethylmalonyl-CoA epimerase
VPARIRSIDLDHVAVAVERQTDAWPRYGVDLGAWWRSRMDTAGFNSAQLVFGNDMKLEVLEPDRVDQNDFLRRFLDRQGPGPHHLTFKVDDLTSALAAAEAAGYHPVAVDRSDPDWQESFLHPKEALGIVIQVAESHETYQPADPPPDFPARSLGRPAALERVVQVVADLNEGLRLFVGLLGGSEEGRSDDGGARSVDLAWPGPGRLRLVEPRRPGPLADWLAGRSGRFHHLALLVDDPGGVPDSRPLDGGAFEVPPEANEGVRLVLRAHR